MKNFLITSAITVSIAGIFGLQGCMKDSYEKSYTYTYYEPVYKTSAQVRAGIKNNAPQPIEKPGKIFVKGQYIFLGEVDKGIHLIDNANPSQPRNIAFIDIPGNMDLTVKGNTLYADLYTDLVAIDISNPQQVAVKKIVDNIFPQRYYNGYFNQDSTKVIASWMKRDTTIKEKGKLDELIRNPRIFMMYGAFSLSGSKDAASVSPYGVGGSMARFTIVNDRLYTVGNSNLDVFNISNPENPVNSARRNIGWNIETIYPFKDKLFIGSTTGMFIYSINNPDNPSQLGQFSHVASCDPVIADDDYAYVTLRSGTTCRSPLNELNILKLNQLTDPTLIQTYAMSNPRGLSKDGNTLFVCDGKAGLKIYNASNVSNLQLLKTIGGMETNDVILLGDKAIVVATDGLYQYDYSDLTNVRLLSKITISN